MCMGFSDKIQVWIAVAAWFTAAATILVGVFTIRIFWVARRELGRNSKISKEDFANKIKNDFYTPEMYYLFFLVENDLLEFHHTPEPYRFWFKLKTLSGDDPYHSHLKTIIDHFHIDQHSRIVLTYVFDEYLLNHFSDLKNLKDAEILSQDDIYIGFEYYITNSGNNPAIAEYIRFSRMEPENKDIFEEFVDLYKIFNNDRSFLDHKLNL